jgi:phosphopentomutase
VPQNGYALGMDIFDLAHAAGLRTVMTVAKEKLRQVTEPASTDFFDFVDRTDRIQDSTTVLRLALNQVNEGFGLMFVHFAEGDIEGHRSGWMSRAQLGVYGREDRGLGSMLQRLKDRGMYETTLIIVTSDHGGHDSTHGSDLPEDMTIPWVVSGPRIVPGELQTQVHTMDTAATAAFALGLTIPFDWDGIPVYEAFGMRVDASRKGGCQGVTR